MTNLEKRKLGSTDIELTVIGLGTWAIGGGGWAYGWGPQEDKDSVDTILEALSLGINWIDTAPVYGFGHSEVIVGKALREWGKPVLIATKCGRARANDGSISPAIKREQIRVEVSQSLERLKVDQIDLYQIHWPVPDVDIEEAFSTLLELKSEGLIRWAGVSNFSVEHLERISKLGPIASLQPPYSLLERKIEGEILPWCKANSVGVIPYSPLQCGLLTGKVSRKWIDKLPEDDWRKNKSPFFREPKLSPCLELVDELGIIAYLKERTLPELAVAWVLNQPGITSAIVGARKKGQIREVLRGASWKLEQPELKAIGTALAAYPIP